MPMFNYNEPTINKPSNPLRRAKADIRSQPALAPRDYPQSGKPPSPPFQAGTSRFLSIGMRTAFLLLILVLVFGAIQVVIPIVKRPVITASASIGQGSIIGDKVNVRSAPSFNGEILGQANSGHNLQIMNRTENGWYQVRLGDGRDAYVFGALLKPDKPGGFNIGISTGDNVRIRRSADVSSGVIASTYKGEKLLISERTGDWYKILLPNGKEGFISANYIKQIY